MPNGSLDKLMKEKSDLSQTKKYIILLGIAEGMKSLHSENIIHCNLTPNNILIDQNLYPHISEYGLLKIIQTLDSSISMKYYSCSPLYMAPEVISKSQYSDKSDVYSFSIIAYELLTGTFPYQKVKNPYSIQKVVLKGVRPKISLIQDESIQLLLNKCWSTEPEDRPTFDEIVSTLKKRSIIKSMKVDKKEVDSYLNLFTQKLPALNPKSKQMKEKEKPKKDVNTSVDSNKKENDIKSLADKGNPKAMYKYAKMLETGEGVTMNKSESIKYYKMAANKGNIDAMYKYAVMLDESAQSNQKEAIRLYKLAADQGQTESMVAYGLVLKEMADKDDDKFKKKEAANYFKMAKEKGNIEGIFNYSKMVYSDEYNEYNEYDDFDNYVNNKKEAVRSLKFAAEKGHLEAMRLYAEALSYGDYIEKNIEEALRIHKEAGEKGNTKSLLDCFTIYYDGVGVDRDIDESFRYLKKAAELGDEDAINELCKCLYKGEVHDIDDKEAARFYKMGIDIGDAYAMLGYGDLLYYGFGIKENKSEAARYYEKAKDLNNDDGKVKLCYMSYKGEYDKGNKNDIFDTKLEDFNHLYDHYIGLVYYEGDGTKNCKDINKEKAAEKFKISVEINRCKLSLYYYGLVLYNGEGIEVDKKKAAHCFAFAAKNGDKRAKKNVPKYD